MKIGIVSDIHEDANLLKEAFKVLRAEGCHQIVCLGDLTGYDFFDHSDAYTGFLKSRNAHEVIKMVKEECEFVLVGNHDLYSIKKLPKHKADFQYAENWYALDYQTRQELSKGKVHLYEHTSLSPLLTKEDMLYIEHLPEYVIKKYGDLKILFSHYAYPDLTGDTQFNIKTSKDVHQHFMFMKKHGCTLGISGHDHCDGIKIFTENTVSKIPFNKSVQLTDEMTWLHGPCVVNGGRPNGVLILNTDTMELTAIPLNYRNSKLF